MERTGLRMNIYLIGMRAVGKSSVGRLLAESLDRPFIDLDLELIEEFGISIAEFVRWNGWKQFRSREGALLMRIAELKEHVVATGGGVVESSTNVELMRSNGWVVWLKAGLNALKDRLLGDGSTSDLRPSVGTDEDPVAELGALLQTRQSAYESAMHIVVDTDNRSVASICREIVEVYHRKALDHHGR